MPVCSSVLHVGPLIICLSWQNLILQLNYFNSMSWCYKLLWRQNSIAVFAGSPLRCYTCLFPTISPLDCLKFATPCGPSQKCLTSVAKGHKGDALMFLIVMILTSQKLGKKMWDRLGRNPNTNLTSPLLLLDTNGHQKGTWEMGGTSNAWGNLSCGPTRKIGSNLLAHEMERW